MAHYANVTAGEVTRVLVVHNDITTIDGVEVEQRGIDFLTGLFPDSGAWVQTSYNDNQRVRYAGVGFTWDGDNDAFYPPQPYPSWTLDEHFTWQPPTPRPDDGNPYEWNETGQAWIELES